MDLYIEYIKDLLVRAEMERDPERLQALVWEINHTLEEQERESRSQHED